eukprot:5142625-Lingulodinium_polyedra.AAC.1
MASGARFCTGNGTWRRRDGAWSRQALRSSIARTSQRRGSWSDSWGSMRRRPGGRLLRRGNAGRGHASQTL